MNRLLLIPLILPALAAGSALFLQRNIGVDWSVVGIFAFGAFIVSALIAALIDQRQRRLAEPRKARRTPGHPLAKAGGIILVIGLILAVIDAALIGMVSLLSGMVLAAGLVLLVVGKCLRQPAR